MGALCGKESSNDPFSQPGRTLSSAPPPRTTSSVPTQRKVGGPPRTLGGSSGANTASEDDARRKAADAAERRAQESKKVTGPLGKRSLQDKSKTMNQVLVERGKEQQAERAMQGVNEARTFN